MKSKLKLDKNLMIACDYQAMSELFE